MSIQPVLIDGDWKINEANETFHSFSPVQGTQLPQEFPISPWQDCEEALNAAVEAHNQLRDISPSEIATFLDSYAEQLELNTDSICEIAYQETALPRQPRLRDVEIPRTVAQLRQAATAAREETWRRPVIDSSANIRACFASIGPVVIFGPNNFPLAFNGAAGGDFAASIAVGCPVIVKANPSHPMTTLELVRCAVVAAQMANMPRAIIQLLYRTSHNDGERLVADSRLGATAYTGSRPAGLKLKAAADLAGKPIYLELSSVNPVVYLPGAMAERCEDLASEFVGSLLLGVGQFCTCPNLIFALEGADARRMITSIATRLGEREPGTLLSQSVLDSLKDAVQTIRKAGAEVVVGGNEADASNLSFQNTLLQVSGNRFLEAAADLQTEVFGNVSLVVLVKDMVQLKQAVQQIEGSLTASIYSASDSTDDAEYEEIAPLLRERVGRLLNDKMPTGVAISPAMNHGGPYPATGHPGFTAVGIPASLQRFATLQCYDNVREHRLPECLRDHCANSHTWRLIDGCWVRGKNSNQH